jgi:omega-hydroxy-beta-dihydromenaquinone-9 sulfotransferase
VPPDRSSQIAFPYPHFMAFAPLDAWARVIARRGIPAAYWLRLAFGVSVSVLGTLLTLPERLVMAVVLRVAGRRSGHTLRHGPGVVVVLGYFRSGTTHLHYLLSCDPRMRTPMWCETLAPQGFALSWSFLRIFMIPFVSAKRPQDDVAIGPEWPAEDDFAVNNWTCASSLMGRFVLPREHAHFDRFHSLEGLSEGERRRWRWTLWAFCWKITRLARGRMLLLKTPSHTARVAALDELFGGNVKFIHISRDPVPVVRSNVNMASRLGVFSLQPPSEGDGVRARVEREYAQSERRYLEQAAALEPGRVSEMRYEDLIADPMGELRRAYAELGLAWTGEFESRAAAYLATVRDYKAAGTKEPGPPVTEELAALSRRFGHDRPARARVAPPPPPPHTGRHGWAVALGLAVALGCFAVWLAQAYSLRDRHDWLAWPTGVLVGWAMIRSARAGSVLLGVVAAAITFTVFAGVAMPATFLMDYAHRTTPEFPVDYRGLPMKDWEWSHILKASRHGFFAQNNLFWGFMGCVTAYRFASRKHVHPPGTG